MTTGLNLMLFYEPVEVGVVICSGPQSWVAA
jgi:hypothetical protein